MFNKKLFGKFDSNPQNMDSYIGEQTYVSAEKALEVVGDKSTFQKSVLYIFLFQYFLFSFFIMGVPFFFEVILTILYINH